jgi:hypothetical protein
LLLTKAQELRFAAFLPKAHRERAAAEQSRRCAPDAQFTGGIMKLRVVVSLLAFLSFLGVAARAQDYSKLDIFGGYSYVRANPSDSSGLSSFNMNGGEVTQNDLRLSTGIVIHF